MVPCQCQDTLAVHSILMTCVVIMQLFSHTCTGKTVMEAGDNPIYALSSDIITISVPPSNDQNGGPGKNKNYVNVFRAQRFCESGLDHDSVKSDLESASGRPSSRTGHHAEIGSSGYENVHLHVDSEVSATPKDREGWAGRHYQNVVI